MEVASFRLRVLVWGFPGVLGAFIRHCPYVLGF